MDSNPKILEAKRDKQNETGNSVGKKKIEKSFKKARDDSLGKSQEKSHFYHCQRGELRFILSGQKLTCLVALFDSKLQIFKNSPN